MQKQQKRRKKEKKKEREREKEKKKKKKKKKKKWRCKLKIWSHPPELKPPTPISDFLSAVLPHRIDHADIEVFDATAPTPRFRETRLSQVKAISLLTLFCGYFWTFEDFSPC